MALTKAQIEQKTKELREFIAEHKDVQGPLMPIMQKAQDLFGYLSFETQTLIADSLGIPVSEVYGVATFYAQFSLQPKGDYVISVCTGTAMDEVIRRLTLRITIIMKSVTFSRRKGIRRRAGIRFVYAPDPATTVC